MVCYMDGGNVMCVGYTASKLSDVMSAGLGAGASGRTWEGDGGSERRIGADDEQIRGLTGIVRQMQDKYRNLAYAFWVRFSLTLSAHYFST